MEKMLTVLSPGATGYKRVLNMITLKSTDLRYSLEAREKAIFLAGTDAPCGVLLHTCNRVEVYSGSGDVPHDVARHLFRVTAGLESAMLGENAIQGQVKAAYEAARAARALPRGLHKLFQHALRVGKRVRTETAISRGSLSHAKAVLQILRREGVDIRRANVLIIGVGHLNTHLVRYLSEQGNRTIYIANRTFSKAEALAKTYGAKTLTFNSFAADLAQADIIVPATSAPHYIIRQDDYVSEKGAIMFDLAVPRDIDPSIGALPHVRLYNIEDVERCVRDNHTRRSSELDKAEEIISEELKGYHHA
jgi:glutamyl-tRNA reductase